MVVSAAFSTPKFLSIIEVMGAMELVVQEALEITLNCLIFFSFTPMRNVGTSPSPLAGAETMTDLAPAFKCMAASLFLTNRPVHSKTTSTLSFFQGSFSGSGTANTGIFFLVTIIFFSSDDTG